MKRLLALGLVSLAAFAVQAQTTTVGPVTRHEGAGTGKAKSTHPVLDGCVEAVPQPTRPGAPAVRAVCKVIVVKTAPPIVAPAPPAPPAPTWTRFAVEGEAFNVAATTTVRYGVGDRWLQRAVSGQGACTNDFFGGDPASNVVKACEASGGAPVVVPPPPPAPPAPPAPPSGPAPVVHFSDCQPGAVAGCVPGSNSNPGTEAAPKQTLAGIDVNALPAGARLLFARGGAWTNFRLVPLDNQRVTPEQPLVFEAYGTGPAPWIKTATGNAIEFGEWNNTSNDGGYTFRNLKFDGQGTANWGMWLRDNLRGVTLENVEMTGFQIAIHSQSLPPHGVTAVTIRNSSISRNLDMGILGKFSDSLIEGNTFDGNNFGGSNFSHAIYYSGGSNTVFRNNAFRRNSVVNGECTGGNFTVHGQADNVLIEGNRMEQERSAFGCYGFSISTGYTTAEWFRNFIVRGNTIVNLGGCSICANSAPGIVIENNRIIQTSAVTHTGVIAGSGGEAGDDPGGNAVVRNNTACYPTSAPGQIMARVVGANPQQSGNVTLTGAAATTGVCAR